VHYALLHTTLSLFSLVPPSNISRPLPSKTFQFVHTQPLIGSYINSEVEWASLHNKRIDHSTYYATDSWVI